MTHLPITIVNTSNHRTLGHFKQGIPCPKGQFLSHVPLALYCDGEMCDTAYVSITNLWDDGSIKWILIHGIIQLAGNEEKTLTISTADMLCHVEPVAVKHHKQRIEICLQDQSTQYISTSTPLSMIRENRFKIEGSLNATAFSKVEEESTEFELLRNGQKTTAVIVRNAFIVCVEGKPLSIVQRIYTFLSTGTMLSTVTFTNPASAEHPNGTWDLGDSHSLNIAELGLDILISKCNPEIEASSVNFPQVPTTIFQASSGTENWQNRIHVDHTNNVNLAFKGFRAYRESACILEGRHIQPRVSGTFSDNSKMVIEVDDFWQHFPSSIVVDNKRVKYSLLGSTLSAMEELQPGEQLTRDFSISHEPLGKIQVKPHFTWLDSSQFFPLFNSDRKTNPFSALIAKAVDGESSFFKKREVADVYGWRHFGELYADHERGDTPQDTDFVSHYNNQYDPICGMLCQWVSTGDKRWKTLADDLAKHVANIDVYHTKLDKPEYAGGLFWHTDHYVQAYTATHRTYSTLQPKDVYQDHAGGGGPGGQHCYTNGLLLHYYLSGSETSKQALLSICDWITRYYEGDGTLVGALLAIKNAGNIGLKNVMTGAYPFDRGTANYLQAILDRFDLLGNTQDLDKCATIIANTVSPNDDIGLRQLNDVETTWFYTVFLQALCRFITVKERLSQNDADYSFAVKSLCHYVHWMMENEYVYLEKSDILEFPNDTWTGQDLRKLCVMNFAKAYFPSNEALISKITELTRGIYERLSKSTEAETTRVLCLMMQNAHYDVYAALPQPMALIEHNVNGHRKRSFPIFLIDTLKRFSLARERRQLAKRFPKFQKWIGKP